MKRILTITFLIFAGCVSENIIDGEGYVFDSKTKQPIEKVQVKSYYQNRNSRHYQMEMMTDSTGYFFGTTGLVGCSSNCPDLIIEFIKDGYKTLEVTNPTHMDTLFLEK